MQGLDETWFLNLVISSAVGAGTSWIISAYYFRKKSRTETLADQIQYGLQKVLPRAAHPSYFDEEKAALIAPDQRPPTNTDIPYVEFARFKDRVITQNQNVSVLIKVRDTGFDLDNPNGISVTDHRGSDLGIMPLGLGYLIVSFHTGPNDLPGTYKLSIKLKDEGQHLLNGYNKNVQTLTFKIT